MTNGENPEELLLEPLPGRLELLEEALRGRAFLAGLGGAELLEDFALLGGKLGRRLDLYLAHHVADAAAAHGRHAGAALAQLLAGLDAGGQPDLVHLPVEARHL